MDGVVLDTESQYDIFWGNAGKRYHPNIPDFAKIIKGTTLPNIIKKYFSHIPQTEIDILIEELDDFEAKMSFSEIAGSIQFVESLKKEGIKVGLVTSSTDSKMNAVNNAIHLDQLFDTIVTGSDVKQGKPNPDCFLLGAQKLYVKPEDCIVFEDSLAGIQAGISAGMTVIGVATTLTREQLNKQSNCKSIIDDFDEFTVSKLKELI